MPISKLRCLEFTSNSQHVLMKAFYDKIDQCLQARYDGSASIWINVMDGLSSKSLAATIVAYKAAGWAVKEHDDQRDGHSLEFS